MSDSGGRIPTSRRSRPAVRAAAVLLACAALVASVLLLVARSTDPVPETRTVPEAYRGLVRQAAAACGPLDEARFAAQLDAESGWNPGADSGEARGVAQFTPDAWTDWGGDHNGDGRADLGDPEDAIPAAGRYMCALYDVAAEVDPEQSPHRLALAGYNAGPGAVRRAGGVPEIDETVRYIARIEDLRPAYARGLG